MTRTDVMASSRPGTQGEGRRTRRLRRARSLLALPVVLLTAAALLAPGTAAAETNTNTSGYNQTPTTPTTSTGYSQTPTTPTTPTTSTPSTTPSTGTSPSKEEAPTSTTPSKETEPTKSSSPAKEASAKTLPFTGFDLRWSFGIGLLLMAAGFSIVLLQRRRAGSR
jgi:hypothetical protein